ncbi:MAG: hydrogenase maturation nickel metallochaperone HypA [Paludibacterium sp.]|uniref:hydrogenase maturation nickel metallochaperone HypA n=1 Tax=Paludibacterium sp. TaxID=1917523 RepID=UPI0025D7ECAE|nr:hydrogenase maturation nickel metallochaperone HypA [Paludibacterium sp.]MBV8047149.1 hydrogenase maturation nickel metallochaperone HypA [Paludibacterium sp.]MBV8647412.1 hydrogenase maturation nickel metallochaperone HypA [Paludibacterium sp.]
MHELMLAESVVRLVEDTARQAGAKRVTRVRLALGALAHVDPDALLYCCELVARDGVAAGAVYEVDRPAAEAWCANCLRIVVPAAAGASCPDCGGFELDIRAGEEMRVIDIAVA